MAINVINEIVPKGFCVGCGTCAGICPKNNLKMEFDCYGEYKPVQKGNCLKNCSLCLMCCPRYGANQNEDMLSKKMFGNVPSIQYRKETGYFLKCYEGYIENCRKDVASGGFATWFLKNLLRNGKVDGVVCVRPNSDPEKLFEFFIAYNEDELRSASGSAYYPVELSVVLRAIIASENLHYAVVGVPCFLTALSLAQGRIPQLKKKILYRVGLVCSHLPNKEYLNRLTDIVHVPSNRVISVNFRDKSIYRNLALGVKITEKDGGVHKLNYADSGPIWSSGSVTPTACMFCDDVFAETAHITFMDAWLPEYINEHYGISIALVRDPICASVFDEATNKELCSIREIDIERVIRSQSIRLFNKRTQLMYRLQLAKIWGIQFPPKRNFSIQDLCIVDKARTIARFYRQQRAHDIKITGMHSIIAKIVTYFDSMLIHAKTAAKKIIRRFFRKYAIAVKIKKK